MGTTTIERKNFIGVQETTFIGTFLFSDSYLAGGEAIDIPLDNVRIVICPPQGAYLFQYVASTGKLKALKANTTTGILEEPVDTTDLEAQGAVPFIAYGN